MIVNGDKMRGLTLAPFVVMIILAHSKSVH